MRHFNPAFVAAGAAACTSSQVVHNSDATTCKPTTVEVAEDDDSVGFTADEAMAALPALLPNHIVWSDFTAGQTEASVSWELGARDGAPQIVTNASSPVAGVTCQPGPIMRLWVELGVDLADGAVRGASLVAIDFWGELTVDTVAAFSNGGISRIPVELGSPYAEEFDAYIAGSEPSKEAVDYHYFDAYGTLADAKVDLGADYTTMGIETIWRGEWSRVED